MSYSLHEPPFFVILDETGYYVSEGFADIMQESRSSGVILNSEIEKEIENYFRS